MPGQKALTQVAAIIQKPGPAGTERFFLLLRETFWVFFLDRQQKGGKRDVGLGTRVVDHSNQKSVSLTGKEPLVFHNH